MTDATQPSPLSLRFAAGNRHLTRERRRWWWAIGVQAYAARISTRATPKPVHRDREGIIRVRTPRGLVKRLTCTGGPVPLDGAISRPPVP